MLVHGHQHPVTVVPGRAVPVVGRAPHRVDAPGSVDERCDVGRLGDGDIRCGDAVPGVGRCMDSIGPTTQVHDVGEALENLRPAELTAQPQLCQQQARLARGIAVRVMDGLEIPAHDPVASPIRRPPESPQRRGIRPGVDTLALQEARVQHRNQGIDERRRHVFQAQRCMRDAGADLGNRRPVAVIEHARRHRRVLRWRGETVQQPACGAYCNRQRQHKPQEPSSPALASGHRAKSTANLPTIEKPRGHVRLLVVVAVVSRSCSLALTGRSGHGFADRLSLWVRDSAVATDLYARRGDIEPSGIDPGSGATARHTGAERR